MTKSFRPRAGAKPRPYRLGSRQEAADRTKSRIVAAAKQSLTSRQAAQGFSIDAIARRAGVTRATVYNGFKSKIGLLVALYDSLASQAELRDRIAVAFRPGGLTAAVRRIVSAYCRLWATNRLVIRRLHALGNVDSGFSRAGRGEWRRAALTDLLARHDDELALSGARRRELVDVLHMLTSFETYDDLTQGRRTGAAVVRLITDLAVQIVGGQNTRDIHKFIHSGVMAGARYEL